MLALLLFARLHRLHALEVMDRFTMAAAVGAAGIRLGNFLNSEIVGRATTVPWAVRFMQYDHGAAARHPSQLHEFAAWACWCCWCSARRIAWQAGKNARWAS